MTDLLFVAGLFVTEAAEALRFARLGNNREAEARAREAYHDALRREGVL